MTCRKSNWHSDRPEQIGPHTELPITHPVVKRLREAGMAHWEGNWGSYHGWVWNRYVEQADKKHWNAAGLGQGEIK